MFRQEDVVNLLHVLQQSIQYSTVSSSSRVRNTFASYLLLLLLGLRKAYLIDCFAPDYQKVLNLLKEMRHRCSRQEQENILVLKELVVVHMEGVVLLVEYEHWKEIATGPLPVIVDICKQKPTMVTPQETESLMDCIYSLAISTISEGLYLINVKSSEVSLSPLQLYPLLTGHYLCYPVCYNFMSTASSTTNALSMQPLRRMSYRVSIPELAHESSLLRDIDLLEFTCPVALLEENSHVAEILDTSTMERKADIENILQESRLKDIFPSIVVNITDNVVTLHNPTI